MGLLLCCNDDIVTLGKMGFMQSVEFSDEPLDSVPLYGISHLFGYGYPQSRSAQPVFFEYYRKMGRTTSLTQLIQIDKILSIQ